MSKIEDGGPAFPLCVPIEFQFANSGMSLRDYFAGQALAGAIAADGNDTLPISSGESTNDALARDAKRRAEWCYAQADAMLSASKATEGDGDV